MSQKKVFFAICVVAVLAALASAAVTPQSCIQDIQDIARTYGQKLQASALKYAEAMSQTTSFDTSGFMKDINGIVSGYMNLADMNTNLSATKLFDNFTALMRNQLTILVKYGLNTSITMGSMNAAAKFMTDIMALNMDAMSSLNAGCIPGSA